MSESIDGYTITLGDLLQAFACSMCEVSICLSERSKSMREDSEEVIISRIWDNHGKEVGYEQKGVLVRCKDCKWWTKQKNSLQGKCILNQNSYPTGRWYCADGERKDDE